MICLLLIIFAPLGGSLQTKCGVVSNQWADIPHSLGNATAHGMSYWWNWAKSPRGKYPNGDSLPWEFQSTVHVDSSLTGQYGQETYKSEFIPMMWGPTYLSSDEITNLRSGQYVMGFNEPDLYGPWHCGTNGGSDYRPATSCGAWDPCFNPINGANNWKTFIDQVFYDFDFSNGPKILSPAMALDPEGDADLCEANQPYNQKLCPGWLLRFKDYTQDMELITKSGDVTNYWDIIDYIQFHAYDYTADSVINKVDAYTTSFQDDIDNGKKFWLTELAGGYLAFDEQKAFMTDVIPRLNQIPHLETYCWFSVWSFPSFEIAGQQPKTTTWVSNLFKIDGSLNKLGQLYFELCTAT